MCPGARCGVWRWLGLGAWLAGSTAAAQPVGPPPPPPAAPAAPAVATAEGADTDPTVEPLRVLVQLDVDDDTELREALAAHFATLPAVLVIRPHDAAPATTGARLRQGRQAAAELGAGAVFWIEAEPDALWLVVMLDPQSGRILAREVNQQPGSEGASAEAAALIVTDATDALIKGEPVALSLDPVPAPATATAPPPGPEPRPTAPPTPIPHPERPPARRRRGNRVAPRPLSVVAGYQVRFVGEALPHHGGVALELGYQPSRVLRLHVLGIALPAATLGDTPPVELGRRSAGVGAGYLIPMGALQLQVGGTLLLETLERHTPAADGYDAEPDDTRMAFGIEPAATVLVPLFPGGRLGLSLRVGAEIMLSNFEYISRDSVDRVVLAPRRVQPGILLGLSLRL